MLGSSRNSSERGTKKTALLVNCFMLISCLGYVSALKIQTTSIEFKMHDIKTGLIQMAEDLGAAVYSYFSLWFLTQKIEDVFFQMFPGDNRTASSLKRLRALCDKSWIYECHSRWHACMTVWPKTPWSLSATEL
jgi:hypothetical protein